MARRRKTLSKRQSRKNFKRGATHTHKVNTRRPGRGGHKL